MDIYTNELVRHHVERINETYKVDPKLKLDYSYNKPKVTVYGGGKDISPRLTNQEMVYWLVGFESGYTHRERTRDK